MKWMVPLILAAWSLLPVSSRAEDWVHWRGPEQTGVSRDTDLPSKFSRDPKAKDGNLVWKAPYGGRSGPLVMESRGLIIDEARGRMEAEERGVCFDAATGNVHWEYKFNIFHTDIVSSRVGWTNLAGDPETETVFAHGVQGLLLCLNKDGKLVWSHSLTEEYGRISGYGGRLVSPIVDGDLVIVGIVNSSWGDQARGSNRFLALDKRTGTPVWRAQPNPNAGPATYYSPPVVADIDGRRLLISGGSDGAVRAMNVNTGEKVWSYTFSAKPVNSSPVVANGKVYIGHGEENTDTTEPGRIVC